jgi:energy-coupling factor transporter ATP-binding protein EcfA2
MVEILKIFGNRSEGLVIMIDGVKFKYKFPCYTLATMVLRPVVRLFDDGKPPALGRVISSMDTKLGVLCDTVVGRAHWRRILLECFLLLWEDNLPYRLGVGHHITIFESAIKTGPRVDVEAEIEKLIGNRWTSVEPFDIVVCDPSQGPTICAQLDRNGLVGSPLRGAPGTKKPVGPVDATLLSVPLPTLKVPTFIVLPPAGTVVEPWKRKKIDAVSGGAVVVAGVSELMEAIAMSGCITINDDAIPPGVFELYAENDELIDRVKTQLVASTDPDKILVLMMGVPGAGKSHVAKAIAGIYTDLTGKTACIASADDYQSDDGFDGGQLPACHRLCRFKVAEAVGTVLVIVDNTNITVADRDPYIAMATGRVIVVYGGSELRDVPADVKILSYTSNNRATPVPVSVSVRMLRMLEIDMRNYGCYNSWLTGRNTSARPTGVVVRNWPRSDVVYYDDEWTRNTNKMAIARDGTDIPHMTLLSAHNTPKGIETPVFETSPILVGPGMVVGPDGKRAWYDLYEWPEAREWVATMTTAPELFHVTRGFDETDIHSVKDRSTLSPHPVVDPRPVVTVVGIC